MRALAIPLNTGKVPDKTVYFMYNKIRRSEYQKKWMQARRQLWFANKKCVKCDSNKRLELDHIVPADKISHNVWSWAEERRLKELAKCQVLCYECHLKKTSKERKAKTRSLDEMHGTCTAYSKYKCRCDICKEYKRKAHKRETARRG